MLAWWALFTFKITGEWEEKGQIFLLWMWAFCFACLVIHFGSYPLLCQVTVTMFCFLRQAWCTMTRQTSGKVGCSWSSSSITSLGPARYTYTTRVHLYFHLHHQGPLVLSIAVLKVCEARLCLILGPVAMGSSCTFHCSAECLWSQVIS